MSGNSNWKTLKLISLPALIITLIINYTMTTDIGTNSDLYMTRYTPANWAFAIWGVIYTSLALMILFTKQFQTLGSNLIFLVSCLINIGWVILWSRIDDDSTYIAYANILTALLPVTLVMLWRSMRGEEYSIERNFVAIYAAWSFSAFIVNALMAYQHSYKNNVNLTNGIIDSAPVLLTLVQVFWFLFTQHGNWKLTEEPSVDSKDSIGFHLVGIWTSAAILGNSSSPKLALMPLLATSSITAYRLLQWLL